MRAPSGTAARNRCTRSQWSAPGPRDAMDLDGLRRAATAIERFPPRVRPPRVVRSQVTRRRHRRSGRRRPAGACARDRQYVGMRQPRHHPRLRQQRVGRYRRIGAQVDRGAVDQLAGQLAWRRLAGQDLDRDVALELRIARAIHRAGAAGAEMASDDEPQDRSSRVGCHERCSSSIAKLAARSSEKAVTGRQLATGARQRHRASRARRAQECQIADHPDRRANAPGRDRSRAWCRTRSAS